MICLMYHRLDLRENYERISGTEHIFTLPVDEFKRQIAYLKDAGYTFVTPDQVRRYLNGDLVLQEPSVLITFDDGCLSVKQYTLPILEKYEACATVFVTTDPNSHIFNLRDQPQRRLTDEELRAIDGDIINVESHAVSHRPLTALSADEIHFELAESKKELERIISREVSYLAIPGNWYSSEVMRIARELGYKAVWCSNPGMITANANPFGLPRLNVEGCLTLPQFTFSISSLGVAQRKAVSAVKRLPGFMLGPRYWLPARRFLLNWIPGQYISRQRIIKACIALASLIVLLITSWYFLYS
ncbi:MAG: polysaccharide deacetylase family protein [Desulfobacterales bacterium]|nr:polysaccharide deacetylase family protein [Desulfobacterales bacterium]